MTGAKTFAALPISPSIEDTSDIRYGFGVKVLLATIRALQQYPTLTPSVRVWELKVNSEKPLRGPRTP